MPFSAHGPAANPVALTLGALSVVVAWAQSVNAGTIVTFCAVAVPAIGGAVIYTIKNVGPAWLEYLARRDEMRSKTLGGQMEELTRSLRASARIAAENEQLAELRGERAEELAGSVKDLLVRVAALTAQVAEADRKITAAHQAARRAREEAEQVKAAAAEATERAKAEAVAIDRDLRDKIGRAHV